jgi:hypothetical protein
MRKAQVLDGVVMNVIEVDPNAIPDFCADWPDAGTGGPGWLWVGETMQRPADPEAAIPASVPKVALVRALRTIQMDGSPASPELPTAWDAVRTALAAAPADLQEDWALLTTIPRSDPTVAAFAAALNVPAPLMDAIFTLADQIDRGQA